MSVVDESQLLEAEHRVEELSGALRKELRLRDLVFSQVLYIVGLQWIGSAGKLGPAHIMYWIPAVLLFSIPSGIVVVHLNREMPLEGGLYQWAKLRFGDRAGFLIAFNMWICAALIMASMISQVTDNLAYAAGPSGAWLVESKWVTAAVAAAVIGTVGLIAGRGLGAAKWLHNIAGTVPLTVIALMVLLALPRWIHRTSVMAPIAFTIPAVSLLNLNILGKMSFGAFSGFDGCAILSGEVHGNNVARTMGRSVWVSGPLIAFIYIMGTASALAFTRPGDMDLIAPTTQALNRGVAGGAVSPFFAPTVGMFMLVFFVGGISMMFSAMVRLPMVAGWDHLLPQWFSRLHPRYRTPIGSVVFLGITTLALTVLGNFGTGAQESFQFLNNAGGTCWGLTYLVMFAIPWLARGERPPVRVRLAAASGMVMTLLSVGLSVFPIVDVVNAGYFTAKMIGIVAGFNVIGAVYFATANKRREPVVAGVRSQKAGA